MSDDTYATPSSRPPVADAALGPDDYFDTMDGDKSGPPAQHFSIRETLQALREAGGDGWDRVKDPAALLGRKGEAAEDAAWDRLAEIKADDAKIERDFGKATHRRNLALFPRCRCGRAWRPEEDMRAACPGCERVGDPEPPLSHYGIAEVWEDARPAATDRLFGLHYRAEVDAVAVKYGSALPECVDLAIDRIADPGSDDEMAAFTAKVGDSFGLDLDGLPEHAKARALGQLRDRLSDLGDPLIGSPFAASGFEPTTGGPGR